MTRCLRGECVMQLLRRGLAVLWLALVLLPGWARGAAPAPAKGAEDRIRRDVTYLASEALEGRGAFTRGLEKAADHIAAEFKSAGLAPVKGGYFQPFTVPARLKDGPARLVLRGPKGKELTLKEGVDFNAMGLSPSGKVDGAEVV